MKGRYWLLVVPVLGVMMWLGSDARPQAKKESPKVYGLEKRELWTTSKVVGSPEPPPPYKTENAFPALKFYEPLEMALAGKRFFVAERKGKVFSFDIDPKVAKADLVLDLPKKTVYGLTLHPKFAENRYLFVTYVVDDNPKFADPKGTRVSRFTLTKTDPPEAVAGSEKVIFEWPNGGHNGGGIRFGPDGFLYLVTGDGSGIGDSLNIGQDLSSVFAKLLRIDVDNPDKGKAYGIPKDNPFVKTPGARPEVYAYGLRQLWRFSFDKKTGDLWGGEVGQDLWEMVYKIEKGGNYGWSVQEGNYPFRPDRKKGPTPILKPVAEHSHTDFRSITGGFVYRGKRLPELAGSYLYADFDTGRVWQYREGKPAVSNELARPTLRIVSWGEDHNNEVYLLDFVGGGIHQLVKANTVAANTNFPKKLSETGLFASTKDHKIATGVIPYSVISQLWGDHAIKERFIAIPGEGKIGFDEITYPQPSPGAPPGWKFPDGTVLVKTFSMEMERGNPKSAKRLETRILHFQQFEGSQEIGDQYWRGYTYVWNDAQTDAELLDAGGKDLKLKIKDNGKTVEQNYRIPSRSECTLCHTNAAKFALGVSTMQMNRDHNYGGIVANQLETLEHIGLFSNKLPKPAKDLPKLVDHLDVKQPIEKRALSYLQSNCSHCHIKWGGGNAEFKLLATLPLKDLGIVDIPANHGVFGIADAKILVPGDAEKSILLKRMNMLGLGRMPHIGSRVIDEPAVAVIRQWIQSLPKEKE